MIIRVAPGFFGASFFLLFFLHFAAEALSVTFAFFSLNRPSLFFPFVFDLYFLFLAIRCLPFPPFQRSVEHRPLSSAKHFFCCSTAMGLTWRSYVKSYFFVKRLYFLCGKSITSLLKSLSSLERQFITVTGVNSHEHNIETFYRLCSCRAGFCFTAFHGECFCATALRFIKPVILVAFKRIPAKRLQSATADYAWLWYAAGYLFYRQHG